MRKQLLYIVCVLAALQITTSYGAVVQSFSRYEVILSRRPFGEAPSEAELAAAKPVVSTGPSFIDSLQMCAITAGGGAVRVGFLDTKSNPPKTYFLFVGEMEDGITVVEADYDAETALLSKDGDERLLSMSPGGTGSSLTAQAAVASQERSQAFKRMRRARELAKRSPEEIALARQLAIERKAPLLKGEDYDKHIRAYNMNLIRAGGDMGVPLPITLTEEEDAQLVSEGVLGTPGE